MTLVFVLLLCQHISQEEGFYYIIFFVFILVKISANFPSTLVQVQVISTLWYSRDPHFLLAPQESPLPFCG